MLSVPEAEPYRIQEMTTPSRHMRFPPQVGEFHLPSTIRAHRLGVEQNEDTVIAFTPHLLAVPGLYSPATGESERSLRVRQIRWAKTVLQVVAGDLVGKEMPR